MILNALTYHSTMHPSMHSLNNTRLVTPSISTHSIPTHSILNTMKLSPGYGPRPKTPPKSVTPDIAPQGLDGEKMKLVEREILKQLLIEQGNLAKVRRSIFRESRQKFG